MAAAVRYFDDLVVGEILTTPGRTITEADVVRYAGISGDHEGLDFSRREPGQPPRVPDPLVVVVTSGLGFRLPVPQPQILAFMVFEWRCMAPVRVGDTIHCRIRISGKRPLKEGGVVVEQRELVNQRGEVVQEAEYKLLVARRPASDAVPAGG
jgi:acyl dehydratase